MKKSKRGRKTLKSSEKKVMIYFFVKKKYKDEAKKKANELQSLYNIEP